MSLPASKDARRGVDNPPHLQPKLKKEYNYTFLSLFLNDLLQGLIYFLLNGPVGVELFLADREAEERTDEET